MKRYSPIFCRTKRSGGAYDTALDVTKDLDPLEERLSLTDGTIVPIEDILEIECETFADHA